MEIEIAVTTEPLEFVSVNVTGLSELSLPTVVFAKVRVAGVSVTDAAMPVPVSGAVIVPLVVSKGCG